MLARLGRSIHRQRKPVLILAGVLVAAGAVVAPSVFDRLKGAGFEDPASESSALAEALPRELGRDEGTLVVLFTAREGGPHVEDPAYRAAVQATLERVRGEPGVGTITTIYNTGAAPLVARDRRSTMALVGLRADLAGQLELAAALRPRLHNDLLQVRLGGAPAIYGELFRQARTDLFTAECLSLPVVAVLLVVIFRSLVAAALPLAIGITTVLGAFLVLRLASACGDVSIFAVNIVSMLGLGLAIDYSLFVVSRFREELARAGAGDVPAALARTMATAGRTVLFSGITVAASLLSLEVFPTMFLRSMGTAGAAVVLVAVLAALTVLPALLAALGPWVNRLALRPLRAGAPGPATAGFWFRASLRTMRRPAVVLALTASLLVGLGLPFLRVRVAIPDARALPPGAESRTVSEVLAGEFGPNETDPIQVLVRTPGPALDAANLRSLAGYVRALQALPGVRRVDSLVTLGPAAASRDPAEVYASKVPWLRLAAASVAGQFAHGAATLVHVIYDGEPYSAAGQQLVQDIRALKPPGGLRAIVGGRPAALVDFLALLRAKIPVALAIIVAVVFVLLFLMLGSLVIPAKAVLLNVLSLSASFGALVWIFQDGHLAGVLRFTPVGSIDGEQPVLIFAVAFGLSMDYEVFLLSRIRESWDRTGDPRESVALGVQRTGAIITGAALLLVAVIASFAAGEVVLIKQIGVGLGIAIAVDATVVRLLLVPAAMQLMGRWNWWAPGPLLALHRRLGLAEGGPAADGRSGERACEG